MARFRNEASYEEIDAAKKAVETATIAYNRGGALDAVNSANRRLADAQNRAYEISGGVVRDVR